MIQNEEDGMGTSRSRKSSAGFIFGRALGQAEIQGPGVKIEANDVVKQGSSQPHSPEWARLPLSSLFPQIFLYFPQMFLIFFLILAFRVRPPGKALTMPLWSSLTAWGPGARSKALWESRGFPLVGV